MARQSMPSDLAAPEMTEERREMHLNVTVEMTELSDVICDVIKNGEERITLLLGLMNRLGNLHSLQYALVHSGDEEVKRAVALAHSKSTMNFEGVPA
jgi:hypothetical protein